MSKTLIILVLVNIVISFLGLIFSLLGCRPVRLAPSEREFWLARQNEVAEEMARRLGEIERKVMILESGSYVRPRKATGEMALQPGEVKRDQ